MNPWEFGGGVTLVLQNLVVLPSYGAKQAVSNRPLLGVSVPIVQRLLLPTHARLPNASPGLGGLGP